MVPTRQRGNHKGVTIGVQTFRFGTQLWSPNLQIWHTVMESKPSDLAHSYGVQTF